MSVGCLVGAGPRTISRYGMAQADDGEVRSDYITTKLMRRVSFFPDFFRFLWVFFGLLYFIALVFFVFFLLRGRD